MAAHRRAEATASFGQLCPAMTAEWRAVVKGDKAIRSPILTIFWHCGFAAFSFRTTPGCIPATNRQRFWPRIARSQGLAMLICSETFGVRKGAARAVGSCALAAAPLPTLLIGGLLLLSCP